MNSDSVKKMLRKAHKQKLLPQRRQARAKLAPGSIRRDIQARAKSAPGSIKKDSLISRPKFFPKNHDFIQDPEIFVDNQDFFVGKVNGKLKSGEIYHIFDAFVKSQGKVHRNIMKNLKDSSIPDPVPCGSCTERSTPTTQPNSTTVQELDSYDNIAPDVPKQL